MMTISGLEDRMYTIFFYVLTAVTMLAIGLWIHYLVRNRGK